MIQSFNVPTDQVAKWAGLMSGVFSLSQFFTGIAWGRASDRFGRKPVILVALTCTMIGTLLFGFSRSLLWAFIVRSLQGLSNGNVGIIRTAVAELVPQKELQPRAFSVMPLVWTIGSIFGPSFGGALVYPTTRFPGLFGKSKLLAEYPFALPNLLISIFFLVSISAGILFLRESLEEKKDHKDYGLILGSLLTQSCSKRRQPSRWRWNEDEAEPFLSGADSSGGEMSGSKPPPKPPSPEMGWGQVFSRQSNINLVVYTILAMHAVAFDQLLPIFMHHPSQSSHDPAVHLPLKFSGGFGIDSSRIGFLFTIYGMFGMLVQFLAFPWCARKYGVLNCLKVCSLVFPLIYLATPFTALLPTNELRQGVMLILLLIKGSSGIFAFPCSTILLTNSAVSLKVLGTLNGIATSVSALGRASGPVLTGAAFSVGVNAGYVITPWWFLAAVAMLGAVPVFWLVEMEGFGASDDSDASSVIEDEEDSEDRLDDSAADAASRIIRGTSTAPLAAELPDERDMLQEETVSLARTRSRSSQKQCKESLSLRKIASPIGMGQGVIPAGARRYSSDLGATRSGFGW
jgi:MFS family permease